MMTLFMKLVATGWILMLACAIAATAEAAPGSYVAKATAFGVGLGMTLMLGGAIGMIWSFT